MKIATMSQTNHNVGQSVRKSILESITAFKALRVWFTGSFSGGGGALVGGGGALGGGGTLGGGGCGSLGGFRGGTRRFKGGRATSASLTRLHTGVRGYAGVTRICRLVSLRKSRPYSLLQDSAAFEKSK